MGFKVKNVPFLPDGGRAINDGINQFIDTFIDPLFKSKTKKDLGITSSGKENPPFKGERSLSESEMQRSDSRVMAELELEELENRQRPPADSKFILQYYDPVVSSLKAMDISKNGTKGKNILANLYKRSPEIKTASFEFRDLESVIDPEKLYTKSEIIKIADRQGLDVSAEVYEGHSVKYGYQQRQNLDITSNLTEDETNNLIKLLKQQPRHKDNSEGFIRRNLKEILFEQADGDLLDENTNKYFEINLRVNKIRNRPILSGAYGYDSAMARNEHLLKHGDGNVFTMPSVLHFPNSLAHTRGVIMDVAKPNGAKERVLIVEEFQTDLFKKDQKITELTKQGLDNKTLKTPIKKHADYIEKLMYSLILHGKNNNVSKIIVPKMDRINEAREGTFDFTLNKKIYESAVTSTLKKIKAEFGNTVTIGQHKIPYNSNPVLLKKQADAITRKYGINSDTVREDIFDIHKEYYDDFFTTQLNPAFEELKITRSKLAMPESERDMLALKFISVRAKFDKKFSRKTLTASDQSIYNQGIVKAYDELNFWDVLLKLQNAQAQINKGGSTFFDEREIDDIIELIKTEPLFTKHLLRNEIEKLYTTVDKHISDTQSIYNTIKKTGLDLEDYGLVPKELEVGTLTFASKSVERSVLYLNRLTKLHDITAKVADPYAPLSSRNKISSPSSIELGKNINLYLPKGITPLTYNASRDKVDSGYRQLKLYREIIGAAEELRILQNQIDKQKNMSQVGYSIDISNLNLDADQVGMDIQARGFSKGGLVNKGLMSRSTA